MLARRSRMTDRSSRPELFYKKGVMRNFAKFTGKHVCQSLFFNKVAGLIEQLWWLLMYRLLYMAEITQSKQKCLIFIVISSKKKFERLVGSKKLIRSDSEGKAFKKVI